MTKFEIGDKVEVVTDGYVDIPRGTVLSVVEDGKLGGQWINIAEVEVSLLNAYSEDFKLTGTRGTAMSLKYKLDDVAVLGENVGRDQEEYFAPGAVVRITALCYEGGDDDHYTVRRVDGKGGTWWVNDDEINHEATEELQESNETEDIVGKTEVVSDDNAEEVRTPVLEENAPQTSTEKLLYLSFFNSIIVAKSKDVSDTGEMLYDENTTKIYLEDEGSGAFLIVEQDYYGAIQQIRLDIDEVDAVFSAIKQLLEQLQPKA